MRIMEVLAFAYRARAPALVKVYPRASLETGATGMEVTQLFSARHVRMWECHLLFFYT